MAQDAARELATLHDFAAIEDADIVVALGGDGFMLQVLHGMLDRSAPRPVFGMNLGTLGFLMNEWRADGMVSRIAAARSYSIHPLVGEVVAATGERHHVRAINEISLLRETRQAAKLAVHINDQQMMEELVCDGVLVATPAGSTAYNLSANGPILPLDSRLLALTPISPFRPRRWRGAILKDDVAIRIDVMEAEKRPVSAVSDQLEVRDIASVEVTVDRTRTLTLLFDPHHGLDDRIVTEQFLV